MDSNGSVERMPDINAPVVGIGKKIPLIEKLFFPAAGGIGAFFNSMVQVYLLFYYTNILRNPILIGSTFVAVQIIAAAVTPVFGAFIDRHTTRWGKYRPWIFITVFGAAFAAFLAFIPVHFGPTGNLVYMVITYAAFSLFSSMLEAAQTGMTAAMTKRQDDRITIAISKNIWGAAGFMFVGYITVPLVNTLGQGNQETGFPVLLLLCVLVFAVLTLLITKLLKERFVISPEQQAKFSFGLLAQTLFKNKYALITIAYGFILSLVAIKSAVNIYYCTYIFNNASMTVTMVTISTLPVIVGLFLSPLILPKLGIKKMLLIMVLVNVITSAAIFFMPPTASGAIAVYVLSVAGFLFVGLARPAQDTMLPFAADYAEWKFNTNSGGFLGAVNGFVYTLYTTVLRSSLALYLVLVGFVPRGEQSAATLFGIRSAVSLIPAALFIVLAFIVSRWDMTEKKHHEMVRETYARHEADS